MSYFPSTDPLHSRRYGPPRGGIGKASALELAKLGCSIAVHYNSAQATADALVTELTSLGVKAAAFQADLSTYDGAHKLHADVVSKLGNPDILFNNSGITGPRTGPSGNIQDVSPEQFEHTWRTNIGTSFLVSLSFVKCMPLDERSALSRSQLTQLCLPHMEAQKYGRIIFCSRYVDRQCLKCKFPDVTLSVAAGTGGVIGPHYASSTLR